MWWGKRADPLVVVGKGMEQNLGGYIAAELLVMATIDVPHTAAGQLLLNTVVGEGLANHGVSSALRRRRGGGHGRRSW